MAADIVVLVDPDDLAPTLVTFRGGTTPYPAEADALAFVARRLADRPALTVQVVAR